MIVWGGANNYLLQDGARYDPISNSWTPMAGAPSGPTERLGHTAVWTGNEMIVWGGFPPTAGYLDTGGRYDPVLDRWSPTALAGAPSPRTGSPAVWTGQRMVVWGGSGDQDIHGVSEVDTGGRYDPIADSWAPTTLTGAPSARGYHSGVWTGSRLVVWGGRFGPATYLNSGGRYDPVADAWLPTSTAGAPAARVDHVALWTGTRMLVWGGGGDTVITGGARYDPIADSWQGISTTGGPGIRYQPTAAWTGTKMVVWGGMVATELNTGALYDPSSNTWAAMSNTNAPAGRHNARGISASGTFVVWGGRQDSTTLASGGKYDPSTNTWLATSTVGAPPAREEHTAVWTGREMIVWGGSASPGYLRDGSRYGISTDADHDGYLSCGADCDDTNAAIHPGVTEVCDGVDQDCDQLVDDMVPLPTTRPTLTESRTGSTAHLSWTAAADATSYDVVRGSLDTLRSSAGNFTTSTTACIANNVPSTTAEKSRVIVPGIGLWHLVRPVNACSGNGTYDEPGASQQGSRDAEISAAGTACP